RDDRVVGQNGPVPQLSQSIGKGQFPLQPDAVERVLLAAMLGASSRRDVGHRPPAGWRSVIHFLSEPMPVRRVHFTRSAAPHTPPYQRFTSTALRSGAPGAPARGAFFFAYLVGRHPGRQRTLG